MDELLWYGEFSSVPGSMNVQHNGLQALGDAMSSAYHSLKDTINACKANQNSQWIFYFVDQSLILAVFQGDP